jgi:hypothetical protein
VGFLGDSAEFRKDLEAIKEYRQRYGVAHYA